MLGVQNDRLAQSKTCHKGGVDEDINRRRHRKSVEAIEMTQKISVIAGELLEGDHCGGDRLVPP